MDDPIFDPWSVFDPNAPSTPLRAQRWRSPSGVGPTTHGAGQRTTTPPDLPRRPPTRLAGTPGFLRSMAMPRLVEIAQQLSIARHDARFEDLLDGAPPRIRLTLRPWRGPTSDDPDAVEGRFELTLYTAPQERVVARFWLDTTSEIPSGQYHVSPAKLGAAWLRARVLEFIKEMLDQA